MRQRISDVGNAAEAIIDRLARLPGSRVVDRPRIEAALTAHLLAAGLDARPVQWVEGNDAIDAGRRGFIAAWADLWSHNKGRPLVVGMTSTVSDTFLHGGGLRRGGLIGAARKEEKAAGRATKREAEQAVQSVDERLAISLDRASRQATLTAAARAALHETGIFERTTMVQAAVNTQEVQRIRQEGDLHQEINAGDAAHQAALSASWLARAHVLRLVGKPAGALERIAAVYLPLVDAVEAGLWLFWVTEAAVIAVPLPTDS